MYTPPCSTVLVDVALLGRLRDNISVGICTDRIVFTGIEETKKRQEI